jgi:hypothetical protein
MAGTNRLRSSARTYLRRIGRQERTKDEMRLEKAVAPLLASAKLAGALCSRDSRHHRPKERHGEGEKEMTSSPMQRRRAWAHRQAPTTGGSEA